MGGSKSFSVNRSKKPWSVHGFWSGEAFTGCESGRPAEASRPRGGAASDSTHGLTVGRSGQQHLGPLGLTSSFRFWEPFGFKVLARPKAQCHWPAPGRSFLTWVFVPFGPGQPGLGLRALDRPKPECGLVFLPPYYKKTGALPHPLRKQRTKKEQALRPVLQYTAGGVPIERKCEMNLKPTRRIFPE